MGAPFAINGFTGFSTDQIISFWVVFAIFNIYAVLTAAALTFFFLSSRPQAGRVRTGAVMHFVAIGWLMLAFISLVWAAPSQKALLDDATGTSFDPTGARFVKLYIGFGFAAVAILCMLAGGVVSGRQRREIRSQALAARA